MSTDEILHYTGGGWDVYEYYYTRSPFYKGQDLVMHKRVFSPFREERDPSFAVHPYQARTNEIWYKDFGDPHRNATGNCFTFVGYMFGFDMKHDFPKIIAKIEQEVLGVYNGQYEPGSFVSKAPPREAKKSKEVIIDAYSYKREWNHSDLMYFAQFMVASPGLTQRQAKDLALEWLEKYIVFPVSRYHINWGSSGKMIHETPTDPIYCIYFPRTGHSKIYRPLTKDKRDKWRSNVRGDVDIFGLHLLPEKADKLFITAGNKDTLAFSAWTGLPCVPLNSETAKLASIYPTISQVTTNMYSLMNNDFNHINSKTGLIDNTGLKAERKLLNEHGVVPANKFLKEHRINDVADFIKKSKEIAAFDRLDAAKDYLLKLK